MLNKTYRNEVLNTYIVTYRVKGYGNRFMKTGTDNFELQQTKVQALNNLDARYEAEQQLGSQYTIVSVRKEKNK